MGWGLVGEAQDPLLPPILDGSGLPSLSLPETRPALPVVQTVRMLGGNTLRALLGVNTLRSTLFTVRRDSSGAFVFEGRGWGHGRGLCQEGAIALAAGPKACDFKAILNRYYAGATLTSIGYPDIADDGEANAAEPPPAARLLTRRSEGREGTHGR